MWHEWKFRKSVCPRWQIQCGEANFRGGGDQKKTESSEKAHQCSYSATCNGGRTQRHIYCSSCSACWTCQQMPGTNSTTLAHAVAQMWCQEPSSWRFVELNLNFAFSLHSLEKLFVLLDCITPPKRELASKMPTLTHPKWAKIERRQKITHLGGHSFRGGFTQIPRGSHFGGGSSCCFWILAKQDDATCIWGGSYLGSKIKMMK